MSAAAETRRRPGTHPTLLIGWGNELRGDDAAGRLLARTVVGWGRDEVRVIEAHQLLPEFADAVADAARVVFVDCRADAPGDAARTTRITDRGGRFGAGGLGHAAGPEEILDLAWRLYEARPEAWLVTVPGSEFGVGRPLSAETRSAIVEAEESIRKLLSNNPPGKEG